MKFYHSFPRHLKDQSIYQNLVDSDEATECGLETLRLLIEFGILLTPERLTIPPNPRSTRERPEETVFLQERACFTLVSRQELFEPRQIAPNISLDSAACATELSHMRKFGAFAIGLNPYTARALGLVPVVYFYSHMGADAFEFEGIDIENISFEILFRIRELRKVMMALAYIESKAGLQDRDLPSMEKLKEIGFDMKFEEQLFEEIDNISEKDANLIVNFLDTDRVPAWNMVDWLGIIFNFFQIADSKKSFGPLSYYQQREWRLVKLFGQHVFCFPLDMKYYMDGKMGYPKCECLELRRRLASVNYHFFSKEKLDRSSILLGTKDKPFFEHVDELIIPVDVRSKLKYLLQFYKLDSSFKEIEATGDHLVFQRVLN